MTSGWIYKKVSVDLLQGRHWGLAASGPLGCLGNHCAPMLAAAVSRERGTRDLLARPDGLGSFSSLSSVVCRGAYHTCKAPGASFEPRGLCVMVGSGAQFRSGLATTYVWLPAKMKCC